MPQVANNITEKYGWDLQKTHLDMAVAKGAAMVGQGMVSVPETRESGDDSAVPGSASEPGDQPRFFIGGATDGTTMSIHNLLSRSVGVRLVRGENHEPYIEHLLDQNSELPVERSITVGTAGEGYTKLPIHLYEQAGEVPSEELEANNEITPESGAVFTGLPHLPKGSPIELNMKVDGSGLLEFTGYEPTTKQYLNLEIKVATLTDEEKAQMRQEVVGLTLND